MNKLTYQIIDTIYKLNCELYDQTENDYIYLDYSTNAHEEIIQFLDITIWSSEYDLRKYVDEEKGIKEDLEGYLRQEINKLIGDISKIKL